LEKRVGKEAVLEEAFDILCPKALNEAYDQEKIEPVTRPDIDVVTLKSNENVVFKATFTPRPEVTLGEYKGLQVEKKVEEVSDEAVEQQLKRMCERQGKMVDVPEGTAVKSGDFITLDFKGFIDGETFEGGEGKDYPLHVGSGSFIPGFEDQLIGAKIGEEVEVNVTFPEDYHEEKLADKPALFKCTVHSIKEMELPPMDDELAKKVSKFETWDELKADVRKNLEANAERKAETDRRTEIIVKATENITVDIPPVMIDNRVTSMIQEMAMRLEQQGMNLETYLQYANTDLDKIRDDYRDTAEKNVRTDLMLEEVAKAEDIKVEAEDLDKEIAEMALTYGVKPKDVKKIIREQGRMADMAFTVLRKKTMKFVVDSAAE
jgi:trigger factor